MTKSKPMRPNPNFKVSYVTWALLLMVITLSTACEDFVESVRGNGAVQTDTRKIEQSFTKISVESGFQFKYIFKKSANPYEVEITTDENILPIISVEVDNNGKLFIKPEKNIKSATTRDLVIKGPVLEEAVVSEGSKGELPSMAIHQENFNVILSGGSTIKLHGKTKSLSLEGSGGAKFEGHGFETQEATIQLSEGSQGAAKVNKNLEATLSGGSVFSYQGNPDIKKSLSGGSQLKTF